MKAVFFSFEALTSHYYALITEFTETLLVAKEYYFLKMPYRTFLSSISSFDTALVSAGYDSIFPKALD